MTEIKTILESPLDQKCGGFDLTVKTAKKKWQVGDIWYQQAALIDSTGSEMLADFKLGQNIPLKSGGQYRIIVAQVQTDEKHGKKLFVDQFQAFTQTVDEYEQEMQFLADKDKHIIVGKCRCILLAAVERRRDATEADYPRIDRHVEFIMR